MFLDIHYQRTQHLFFYYLLHMKMKKFLFGAFLWMFALAGVAALPVNAQNGNGANTNGQDTSFWGWWGNQTTDKYQIEVAWSWKLQGDSLINVIKTAINWVLGMLSLIALAIALYAGFLMMTSGGDEKKYSKGIGLLKWAGIWLAIIALSWLIVSLIFRVINGAIGNNTKAS